MSEYWKSLPRKFCDICKCWFADNKASIEFHERGKRHQENAQKRIQEIQKKGIKDFKKQKQLEDDMAKIEKAALAAYKKDLQNAAVVINSEVSELGGAENGTVIPEKKISIEISEKKKPARAPEKKKLALKEIKKEIEIPTPVIKEEPQEITSKVWYEAMSEDGFKYYWNTLTSETQWEPPTEGYISVEEQEAEINSQATEEANESSAQDTLPKVKEEPKEDNTPTCSIGPQPKIDPYGQWTTIVKEEPKVIDLQLPKPNENFVEVVIPVAKDDSKLKFKEKVITHLTDADPTEEVTFKKRKFAGSFKKNVRQRTVDD